MSSRDNDKKLGFLLFSIFSNSEKVAQYLPRHFSRSAE